MSSLIYLSYQQHEVILDRDFQFIILANGLDLLSESTYRLMMGKLADICQTERIVSVACLNQWCAALHQELANYLSHPHQEASNIKDVLQQLNALLALANQDNAQTLMSCCV
ncbi:MAG TPA: hypothetical protein PKI88_09505 [Agitococcus sp.]|nr:hypothetical protein [Agitococcus sp.]